MWRATPPYYVVNVGRDRSTTHIVKTPAKGSLTEFWENLGRLAMAGGPRRTLCGLPAARTVDVFEPTEASCRECRKRWQLAIARDGA